MGHRSSKACQAFPLAWLVGFFFMSVMWGVGDGGHILVFVCGPDCWDMRTAWGWVYKVEGGRELLALAT